MNYYEDMAECKKCHKVKCEAGNMIPIQNHSHLKKDSSTTNQYFCKPINTGSTNCFLVKNGFHDKDIIITSKSF